MLSDSDLVGTDPSAVCAEDVLAAAARTGLEGGRSQDNEGVGVPAEGVAEGLDVEAAGAVESPQRRWCGVAGSGCVGGDERQPQRAGPGRGVQVGRSSELSDRSLHVVWQRPLRQIGVRHCGDRPRLAAAVNLGVVAVGRSGVQGARLRFAASWGRW